MIAPDPAAAGINALLLALVLGIFELVKMLLPTRKLECPNKIHTLNATIESLEENCAALEKSHRSYSGGEVNEGLDRLENIERAVKSLEAKLGPVDGIEQWKRNQMQDVLLQKIIDASSESVALQRKTLLVLEKIAVWPQRQEDKANGKRNPKRPDESSPR